MEGMKRL